VNVRIPSVLETYTGGRRQVEADGETLAALIADLDRRYPGIRFRMIDERDQLRPHMRIFVNGTAPPGLEVAVTERDEVVILQALSGG
jgi:sulfur-carrier protein